MGFQYNMKSPSVWRTIKIQDTVQGVVVTVYYEHSMKLVFELLHKKDMSDRLLTEREKAIVFSMLTPKSYADQYIKDDMPLHKGLHKDDNLTELESMHRHILFSRPFIIEVVLKKVIQAYEKIKTYCVEVGEYPNGAPPFITPEDEEQLKKQYALYLSETSSPKEKKTMLESSETAITSTTVSQVGSTMTVTSTLSSGVTPAYDALRSIESGMEKLVLDAIEGKFGREFMERYKAKFVIITDPCQAIILSNTKWSMKGKEWLLKREPNCQFETTPTGEKLIIPVAIKPSIKQSMLTA